MRFIPILIPIPISDIDTLTNHTDIIPNNANLALRTQLSLPPPKEKPDSAILLVFQGLLSMLTIVKKSLLNMNCINAFITNKCRLFS